MKELFEKVKATELATDKERPEILKSLDVLPYRDRKDRNSERVEGTCVWFTENPLFHTWRDSVESRFLWLSANPGCGKSVLARYLVDEVLPSTDTRTTCYFFFKDDFDDQKSLSSALCCVLRQIIDQKPNLLTKELVKEFKASQTVTKSFQDLWDMLVGIAGNPNAGEIICVIDAFDECEQAERQQLIAALNWFYSPNSLHRTKCKVKVFLTSRPYFAIHVGFKPLKDLLLNLHLDGDDEIDQISQEINIFIMNRISDLKQYHMLSEYGQATLQQAVTQIRHRTYLWAHLIFDDLARNFINLPESSLRNYIRELPRTVEGAYDKILRGSSNPEKAKRLLSIIVAAEQPLLCKEMAVVLDIRCDHRTYSHLELDDDERFCTRIRELCGLFVIIVDSKIYLLHQTAREFLVRILDHQAPNPATTNKLH
ncbi:uncharacterized protein F4822DRAFT_354436 [Hypoxylon trugodes]|uniref:uncharacterized protein n=1 Tax=Hypoxylon trugodes TaxID=326681 RepID=UPI002190A800|nr:uncharacterized protein F4822DRAFT_354436 [Hypoxylon trugodes]KAI1385774.1 hypothetical protein F4822DRAFT_354436 [Hypoxylon trugodes]